MRDITQILCNISDGNDSTPFTTFGAKRARDTGTGKITLVKEIERASINRLYE